MRSGPAHDRYPLGARTNSAGAVIAAAAAFVLGAAYAAISAYWGIGGTALLNTVGGAFQREGQRGGAGLVVIVWLTVLLKLAAAGLGLIAAGRRPSVSPHRYRQARIAGWAAALILTLYGGVLSIAGWLVQSDVIAAGPHADHRALRWHAFLWDPWFLIWGLLLLFALARTREPASAPRAVQLR